MCQADVYKEDLPVLAKAVWGGVRCRKLREERGPVGRAGVQWTSVSIDSVSMGLVAASAPYEWIDCRWQ